MAGLAVISVWDVLFTPASDPIAVLTQAKYGLGVNGGKFSLMSP